MSDNANVCMGCKVVQEWAVCDDCLAEAERDREYLETPDDDGDKLQAWYGATVLHAKVD